MKNIELQTTENHHFVFAGFITFEEVLKRLKEHTPFYRIVQKEKKVIKETFYDNDYNMLSDAGIVLSKSTTKENTFFNIRRISRATNIKDSKYRIDGKCQPTDHPKDYTKKIASAIENTFMSPLTIDLESIVKKTSEKIEVVLKKTIYDIICGTGYRALITHEEVSYKDIASGNKVLQEGATLTVPTGEFEETSYLLNIIERKIPNLVLYNESRFEIAQKLLYTEGQALQLPTDEEEDK